MNTTPLFFADYTNLFASDTDLESFQACVNRDLTTISEGLKANKLPLNVRKNTAYYLLWQKKTRFLMS